MLATPFHIAYSLRKFDNESVTRLANLNKSFIKIGLSLDVGFSYHAHNYVNKVNYQFASLCIGGHN